jgi:hypothetical protein
MFRLQQAIIRPEAEQSPGTFNDCALYGIPYSLQWDPIQCTINERTRTSCFHRAPLLLVTFINRLMHSIKAVIDIKICVVLKV